ncbi:MAG: L,D-transpeptidase [Bacteroidales bacterium]|nr:L,D-transpeptidase [Lachnoclostridium sp.]MCM1384524.1 L,D-transpeptidase [Lachnoclostridium sp.]MCM1464068.1 L,D-transpeptidase [Bacteroidales bacterium]
MGKIIKKLILISLSVLFLFKFDMLLQAKEPDLRPTYTVYVNRTQNCVTVMEQKEDGTSVLAKVMACSCGREGHETPEGVFKTSNYYEWCAMVDGTYGKYSVRFNKAILFHSVPYLKPSDDTLEWDQYNLLGQNASLGCVRLSVVDAKWIYDNCKVGTTVIVYSGDNIVGDAVKPATVQIPEDSPYRNWDPTNLNSNNPWLVSGFDYMAYADRYPDLKKAFGYDKTALYTHYVTFGISEGRVAEFSWQAIEFDYIAYADRYPDLKRAFGYDKTALYNHYITFGISEGRIAK